MALRRLVSLSARPATSACALTPLSSLVSSSSSSCVVSSCTSMRTASSDAYQGTLTTRFAKGLPKPLVLPDDRKGAEILHDPFYNKGTAFPSRERDRLGIRGLLPTGEFTLDAQTKRAYAAFHRAGGTSDRDQQVYRRTENLVAKHLFLVNLQDRNETLFYNLLCQNLEEMAPIIYTPIVGYACLHAGQLFRRSRGLYLNGFEDRGDMSAIVRNWPEREVDVIVITDGSRILGLGDLGAHGMPIPVGKLSLYVAAGGIHPTKCMPVLLDVGTNNLTVRNDPLYLGTRRDRMDGEEYIKVVDEAIDALRARFPKALIQFEDFRTPWAEFFLARYRQKVCMFNDDVQGTGTMVLAAILGSLRVQGKKPKQITEQRIVCLGAGSAGLGVCGSLMTGMMQEGLTADEARSRFWLVDKDGLLTNARGDKLAPGQSEFARSDDFVASEGMSLNDVIAKVKPTILLGLSGVGGTFNEQILRTFNAGVATPDIPILFALSNPTEKSECTAEQAYDWMNGRVIFAGGSPFKDVTRDGKVVLRPTQGNNMFVFPGVGLGVVACRAKRVSSKMFYNAAKVLAEFVPESQLKERRVLPSIRDIRQVSRAIAIKVAQVAEEEGLATMPPPEDETWESYITDLMWTPDYQPLVRD